MNLEKTVKTSIYATGKSILVALVLTCLPLTMTGDILAQEKPEPAAVISIAPLDEQLKDVEYLAKATSEMFGAMSGMARMQAEGFLPGVDFSKPSGILLYFDEGNPEPKRVGFFPVSNLDDILDKVSEFAEVEEDGDAFTITPDSGDEMRLKSQGDYAFVSDTPELLGSLPADPISLVKAATQEYNISAELYPQRIPENLRQQMMDFLKEGVEAAMDDMDDFQAELQEAQFQAQMKQMESWVNDFEKITVGFNADQGSEKVYFDVNMKGLSGSGMAKKLAAAKTSEPSRFAGFLMNNAAFTMHNCSGISKEDADLYADSMDNMRDSILDELSDDDDEAKAKILSKISKQLTETVKKTLADGTLDMGGVVFTDDGLNAAFGAKVVDARNLESSIKEIVVDAESEIKNDEVVFNLNSGSHGGFTMHEILVSLDLEDLDESIEKMFGEKITVLLAINDDQVYVGAGRSPGATVKKAIDANAGGGKNAEMIGQYNFFMTPIMNLLASVQPDQDMFEAMREKIAEVGKDRVGVTYDVVGNEMKVRVEMQDGIFQLYGVAIENLSGMGGGGADF